MEKFRPQVKLSYFCLHLVEHCNLTCKGCDHFSPLAQKKYLDLKVFNDDFVRLSSITNGLIERIGLMGGEPLLHPKLSKFLPIARECFPKTNIQIVTNGLLLLKQPVDFWEVCAYNKIEIVLTKYPVTINFDKIEKCAEHHNVSFKYFGDTKDIQKTSYFIPLNLQGNSNQRINFLKCHHANNCIFLKDGKLFPCPVAPNINHFNEYFKKLPGPSPKLSEKDGIDIYKAQSYDEILAFLAKPIPFCKFCAVDKRCYNLEWGLSKKDMCEWVFDDKEIRKEKK